MDSIFEYRINGRPGIAGWVCDDFDYTGGIKYGLNTWYGMVWYGMGSAKEHSRETIF